MQMSRRRDRHGLNAFRDQFVEAGEGPAIRQVRCALAVRRQGIGNPDQMDAGKASQYAGVIAAHDTCANNPDAQRLFWFGLHARTGPHGFHFNDPAR
jgi:hypothetical protein